MNKKYMLNTVLAYVLGLFLLARVLVRSFAPRIILLELDIPMLVLLTAISINLPTPVWSSLAKGSFSKIFAS